MYCIWRLPIYLHFHTIPWHHFGKRLFPVAYQKKFPDSPSCLVAIDIGVRSASRCLSHRKSVWMLTKDPIIFIRQFEMISEQLSSHANMSEEQKIAYLRL